MPYPHVIRLRGPWELIAVTQQDSADAGSQPQKPATYSHSRVEVPGDWACALGTAFRGTARYTRRFNTPTGLEGQERVWLCCEGVHEIADIRLNDRRLGQIGSGSHQAEYDITDWLRPHNQLVIEVSSTGALPGALGEVRLEIRKA